MAETAAPKPEVLDPSTTDAAAAVDMVVENAMNEESNQKRTREEGEIEGVSKKQKVDAEEDEEDEEAEAEEKKPSGPVKLGHKTFGNSLELFDYFNSFLHDWAPNLNVNKYEHKMLLELIMKGHPEPDKKIGGEICAFQVRRHPMWKSKCFFLIREDESADDFSFRKCVDHILPLPEAMQVKHDANRALGGSGGAKRRGGRGGSRGHGRKGKSRH